MKTIIIWFVIVSSLFAGVVEGEKAIDFRLKDLRSHRTYSLEDFKGKVVLLNIWASWCSGCKKEMPEFFALQKAYDTNDFLIVTVSIDKDPKNSSEFLHALEAEVGFKTPFITLYDPQKQLPRKYGVKGMPSSYLIDQEGKIAIVIVGSLGHDDIEALKKEINTRLKR